MIVEKTMFATIETRVPNNNNNNNIYSKETFDP
jgi:hypothetical protein